MRLSESLNRNIIETGDGTIINKFLLKSRRNVLFPIDIFGRYVKYCEAHGYSGQISLMGKKWGLLIAQELAPGAIKMMPPSIQFNFFMGRIWSNIGMIGGMRCSRRGKLLNIKTKNEIIRHAIGDNVYSASSLHGVVCGMLDKEVIMSEVKPAGADCEYVFEITDEPLKHAESKGKNYYNKLNYGRRSYGDGIARALHENFFTIRGNRIYFRDRLLMLCENSLYHIIGNEGIFREMIADISREFFGSVIERNGCDHINLLKNFLQICGWGNLKIIMKDNGLDVVLQNMPFGLQAEKDNWSFIAYTILGYLRLIDEQYAFGDIWNYTNSVKIGYVRRL